MIFLLISMTYVHFETAATLCFTQIFPNISISGDVGGGVYIDIHPPTTARSAFFGVVLLCAKILDTHPTCSHNLIMTTSTSKPTRRGAPRVLIDARRMSVNLTERHAQIAAGLGNGSISAGIRAALDALEKKEADNEP